FIDVNSDGDKIITNWREKPEISGFINIGCYVFEPGFLNLIPESSSYGMDDAVRESIKQDILSNILSLYFIFLSEGIIPNIGIFVNLFTKDGVFCSTIVAF